VDDIFGMVSFKDNGDEYQMSKLTYEMIKKNWITSYDYREVCPIVFVSREIPKEFINSTMVSKNISYVFALFESIMQKNTLSSDEFLQKEINTWDSKGGLCVYLSVLLYCLLIDDKVCTKEKLKLTQGYYRHTVEENTFQSLIYGKFTQGFHVWLNYDGFVIDSSIGQEVENGFNFKGFPYIIGKIPEGLELVGHNENWNTVKTYLHRISKESNMKPREWIVNHQIKALEYSINLLSSI
jgi:hypothetical protein